jgi:hypothetical protein
MTGDALILNLRELINVVLAVFAGVMTVLFAVYVGRRWKRGGYRGIDPAGRAAIGFGFITFGEFARASIIWQILHYEVKPNYLTDAPLLIISLITITIGSLYCIRVFSPPRRANLLWVSALAAAAGLSVLALVIS